MAQPFSHDELPLKQYFLNTARDLYQKSLNEESMGDELAAAVLYMNLADYLAEYLVTSLTQMAKEAMNKYYLGITTIVPQQKDGFNMGNAIYALKGFDFPKKVEIMHELEEVNKTRKKIAHEIVKTKGNELLKIDEAAAGLVEHTEALVILVDEISAGMPPRNLIENIQAAGNVSPEVEAELPIPEEPRIPTKTKKKIK